MKPVGSTAFASLTLVLKLPQAERCGSRQRQPEHVGFCGASGRAAPARSCSPAEAVPAFWPSSAPLHVFSVGTLGVLSDCSLSF